jgi:hypothetical protein
MNTGRFVGASLAVFIARFAMNFLFYGMAMKSYYDDIAAAHPGITREVIAAYGVLDLVSAILIVYFFVKAGAAFGGGIKGGVVLGILIAILCPVIGGLYFFYSVTYYPMNLMVMESVYQIIAHAIQGAVAAAIYKAS